MTKFPSSNNDAKLAFLNGHFNYYLKCNIATNGLSVVRDINFYNFDNNIELDLRTKKSKVI